MTLCTLSHFIVILYTAIPTPSTEATCLVSTLPDGRLNVLLQWFSSYNSDYDIQRYDVTVTPDPTSCSSDQVSPSEDYSCSELDQETDYTITVSAINCGDREGRGSNFSVQKNLLGMHVVHTYVHNMKGEL